MRAVHVFIPRVLPLPLLVLPTSTEYTSDPLLRLAVVHRPSVLPRDSRELVAQNLTNAPRDLVRITHIASHLIMANSQS